MTPSKETIELIEKEYRNYCKKTGRGGGVLISSSIREVAIHLATFILTDPSILASVKGDEWVRVEDSIDFFNLFHGSTVTVLCQVVNIKTKKSWWEMYHAEIDDSGDLYYADGSGDCGVTYKDVAYYREEKFPPLPTPPKTK